MIEIENIFGVRIRQDEAIRQLTKRVEALEKEAMKRKRDTEDVDKQWREKTYHNIG